MHEPCPVGLLFRVSAKGKEMKTRILFLLSAGFAIMVFTNCDRGDYLVVPEILDTSILVVFPSAGDTLDPGSSPGIPLISGPTTAVFPVSLSCTGVMVGFSVPFDDKIRIIEKGVCVDTLSNPTTSDIVGYTEKDRGILINDVSYNSVSSIDGLQPATQYYARSFYSTADNIFYNEEIFFITHPKPIVTTNIAGLITPTSAIIGGNITSTGGSFVVERGF